jgi:uncharacterized membrane protein (UPF0127 family)
MPSFLSVLPNGHAPGWALRKRGTPHTLSAQIETAFDSASRRRGLLGRDGLAPGAALIIAPCPSIHTFFMRFPIDVIFVAGDGRVVKVSSNIPAWRIAIGAGAFAVIEMAAGSAAASSIRRGDHLELVQLETGEE